MPPTSSCCWSLPASLPAWLGAPQAGAGHGAVEEALGSLGVSVHCAQFGWIFTPLITDSSGCFCLTSLYGWNALPERRFRDFIQFSERWGIVGNLSDTGNWQEIGNLSGETNTPEIHRMIWVGKDVEDHPVPTSLPPRCRVVWLERFLVKTETKNF